MLDNYEQAKAIVFPHPSSNMGAQEHATSDEPSSLRLYRDLFSNIIPSLARCTTELEKQLKALQFPINGIQASQVYLAVARSARSVSQDFAKIAKHQDLFKAPPDCIKGRIEKECPQKVHPYITTPDPAHQLAHHIIKYTAVLQALATVIPKEHLEPTSQAYPFTLTSEQERLNTWGINLDLSACAAAPWAQDVFNQPIKLKTATIHALRPAGMGA